jgi:predicted small integral membrane protein
MNSSILNQITLCELVLVLENANQQSFNNTLRFIDHVCKLDTKQHKKHNHQEKIQVTFLKMTFMNIVE